MNALGLASASILFGLEDRQWILLATVVFASTFALGFYSALFRHRRADRSYILTLVSTGWILQTIGLYARGLEYGGCPLGNQFELIQFMVWSSIILYIFVGPAFRVSLLGVFTSGFAAIFSIVSLASTSWDPPERQALFGDSPWIETHAALALFSYGVFGILALTSVMYLLQSRSLKTKQMGGLFPFMPSIVELAQINKRMLLLGFLILSFSLGIGSVYWTSEAASIDALKLGATIAVWLAYGILLLLRYRQILSSKQYSWACISIFIIALVSLEAVDRDNTATNDLAPPEASVQEIAPGQ